MVATLVFVACAGVYLGRVSSWRELGTTTELVGRDHLLVLGLITLGNLVSYWLVTASVLPGLGLARAGAVHLPANAISNAVPGGGAVATGMSVAILGRWGYPPSKVAAGALVSGLWNNLAKLSAPILALVAVALTGSVGSADVAVAGAAAATVAVVAVCLAALLRSERSAAAVGRRAGSIASWLACQVGRSPVTGWDAAAVRLHRDIALVVHERWPQVTAATLVSHGTLFVLFAASLDAVGLGTDVFGPTELLGVFALARMASLVPLTPGGTGLIEVTLMASLAAAGGDPEQVVVGVVVYRLATYAVPTVLGGLALLGWLWSAGRIWSHGAASAEPATRAVPLVVDLDGTLFPVTSRSLMIARLAWTSPSELRSYHRLHNADRLASKRHLWEQVGLDIDRAPLRRVLLRWLESEHATGRSVVVASGAPDELVSAVVARHAMFSDGWGSTGDHHLVGAAKAALLVDRFGEGGFDYVGDAKEDLAVWRVARRAVLCTPSRRVTRLARRATKIDRVFARLPAQALVIVTRTLIAAWRQRPRAVGPTGDHADRRRDDGYDTPARDRGYGAAGRALGLGASRCSSGGGFDDEAA